MLSGRGIDGELKSKFGEWSEKFWQSGVMNGNLRAIYFANGEGGSGGGGETLTNLGSSDKNTKLITTENGSADKVKSLFSVCVGNQNGSGCKENDKKASVVLVGDDPDINSSLTWEKLKSENWGQTSLVRSGHSYEGLFRGRFWKGHTKTGTPKLNRIILPALLRRHRKGDEMKEIFCPWVSSSLNQVSAQLQPLCGNQLGTARKPEGANLADFLTSSSSKTYFKEELWDSYGPGWEWFAFLALVKLWSTDLTHVNYGGSNNIFDHKSDGFSLRSLIRPSSDVIFASLDSENEKITSIDRYSSDRWTVLLRGDSGHNGPDRSLSVTLAESQLCIRDLVCLDDRSLVGNRREVTGHLRSLDSSMFGNFLKLLLNDTQGKWDSKKTFMALIAACFKDVEKVSFTVQKPSKEGQLIFKLMEEKK